MELNTNSEKPTIKYKTDTRPRKNGWCNGDYLISSCRECGESFTGDKRSWECADCAYREIDYIPDYQI